MNETQTRGSPARKKYAGRVQLAGLALLFALPLVLALLWTPGNSDHHGVLIEPPRPLPAVALYEAAGNARSRSFADFAGQWTLVFFKNGPCGEPCRRNLYNARQVRLSQGRHAHRVSLLLIAGDGEDLPAALRAAYPEVRVWRAGAQAMTQLNALFTVASGAPPINNRVHRRLTRRVHRSITESGHLYLVDPFGNLMMQFSADLGPGLVRKDLGRLLKYSTVRGRDRTRD